MARIALAIVATALLFGGEIGPGHAGTYGNAPWCAVVNQGSGDFVWDCEYRSAIECAPNVTAGNRGFCNLNPAWVGPPLPAPHPKRHARHP